MHIQKGLYSYAFTALRVTRLKHHHIKSYAIPLAISSTRTGIVNFTGYFSNTESVIAKLADCFFAVGIHIPVCERVLKEIYPSFFGTSAHR